MTRPGENRPSSSNRLKPVMPGYRAARADQDASGADVVVDLYLPTGIIATSILIELIFGFFRGGAALVARWLAIELVIGSGVLLLAMLIAVKARGIALGSWPSTILKLIAIALAPGATLTLLEPIFITLLSCVFVPLVGFVVPLLLWFVVVYTLVGALFNLAENDTWYCVCVFFVLLVASFFLRMWLGI